MTTQTLSTTAVVNGYRTEWAHHSITFAGESSGEIVQMIPVKRGYRIRDVRLTFADLGTGVTIVVGDGADTDRFILSTDVASAAGGAVLNNVAGSNYTYTADDTIDIVTGGAAATGLVRLSVEFERTFNS